MAKKTKADAHADVPDPLARIAPGLWPLAVPIGDLVPDPANARTHGEKNLEAIRGSLAVYGQLKPVVVRRDNGVVVAGNGTLEAARSLGWTHLAAVYTDMSAAEATGFAIADNRAAELAGWDQKALDALLREVNTGNDPRLDAMLSELAEDAGLIPALDDDRPGRRRGPRGRRADHDQDPGDGGPGDGAPAGAEGRGDGPAFGLLVTCASAEQQAELLERFTAEGLLCRSVNA